VVKYVRGGLRGVRMVHTVATKLFGVVPLLFRVFILVKFFKIIDKELKSVLDMR